MSEIEKKSDTALSVPEIKMDIANGGLPSDHYSESPCLIGYSYIRFEVTGDIVPCCIAKHSIGSAYTQDWRDVWHSGAYENFRKKMSKIHVERFHLVDPEWTFCQQCSHLPLNREKAKLLKKDQD